MAKLETVELQLSELEMLTSIYPNEKEVVVQDLDVLSVMKRFQETDGNSYTPTKRLTIAINLELETTACSAQLQCSLPLSYPLHKLPEVFVRCSKVTRQMQNKLNEDMQSFIKTIPIGECCLYQIAQWVVDNIENYITNTKESTSTSGKVKNEANPETTPQTFTRLWIYSHHIYNKIKRKSILEWAKELDLTGFSMPGKPGVVCVEGSQEHCEEYWQRVKQLSWKNIEIRHSEISQREKRKFGNITEISFEVHGHRNNHMDMGAFNIFLQEHQCNYIFKYLFGIEGRIAKSVTS
ncbi:RWD domain-containing protein 2B-like isoform X2 [Clavelina lepadiformis]|uniref:RWD domain-containing protein 2B-like isoform X2 n=1 Tax=Clavelina lepadiformis TaxID=159417 RepID=UPI00404227BE